MVEGKSGHFLDKKREKFIKHGPGETPYVHKPAVLMDDILAQKEWVPKANVILPGKYIHSAGSDITGDGMTLHDFVEQQMAQQAIVAGA